MKKDKALKKANRPKMTPLERTAAAKTFAVDVLCDILGGILYSAGIYTFVSAANFAPGGVAGLSILVNHFTDLPIGICMIILNIPIVLLTYRALGKRFLLMSLKSMVIFSVIMDVIFPLFPVYSGDPLLAALFGGMLSGAGVAFVYIRGASTGGSDFVIMCIRKKAPHLSIGTISLATEIVVILIGGLVFSYVEAVLYGIIVTVVCSVVIDAIMGGFSAKRMAIIITNRDEDIVSGINDETGRGVTIIEATGSYTGEGRRVLMCACTKTEAFRVRRAVNRADSAALVFFCSVDEAFGLGFEKL